MADKIVLLTAELLHEEPLRSTMKQLVNKLMEVMVKTVDMIIDWLRSVKNAVSASIDYICTTLKDIWDWLWNNKGPGECGQQMLQASPQAVVVPCDAPQTSQGKFERVFRHFKKAFCYFLDGKQDEAAAEFIEVVNKSSPEELETLKSKLNRDATQLQGVISNSLARHTGQNHSPAVA